MKILIYLSFLLSPLSSWPLFIQEVENELINNASPKIEGVTLNQEKLANYRLKRKYCLCHIALIPNINNLKPTLERCFQKISVEQNNESKLNQLREIDPDLCSKNDMNSQAMKNYIKIHREKQKEEIQLSSIDIEKKYCTAEDGKLKTSCVNALVNLINKLEKGQLEKECQQDIGNTKNRDINLCIKKKALTYINNLETSFNPFNSLKNAFCEKIQKKDFPCITELSNSIDGQDKMKNKCEKKVFITEQASSLCLQIQLRTTLLKNTAFNISEVQQCIQKIDKSKILTCLEKKLECKREYKSGCEWVEIISNKKCLARTELVPLIEKIPNSLKDKDNFYAGLAICPFITKSEEPVLAYCYDKSSVKVSAKKCLKSDFETEKAKRSLYDYCKKNPKKCFP